MKQNLIINLVLFFLFSFSITYAATSITNSNVWTHTAVSGDTINNTAWNEVCGTSEPVNGTVTAAEWLACAGTSDADGIITAAEWNALVDKKRITPEMVSAGCDAYISLGGLQVCGADSKLNPQYTSGSYPGYYDWYHAGQACPIGHRVPTDAEWGTLLTASSNNYVTLRTNLGLGLSGIRFREYGSVDYKGSYGYYWSSTAYNGTYARNRRFHSGGGIRHVHEFAYGFSVRCIKD